jgi:hypothetical protein
MPLVKLHSNLLLGHFHAFGFQEFSLQRSVRFADEKFPACANHAVPGNSFAGGAGRHSTTRRASATGQAQGPSKGPIS